MAYRVDRRVYRTAGADLTDDKIRGASLFRGAGREVSKAEVEAYPVLAEWVPELRLERETESKQAAKPEDKQSRPTANKRRRRPRKSTKE